VQSSVYAAYVVYQPFIHTLRTDLSTGRALHAVIKTHILYQFRQKALHIGFEAKNPTQLRREFQALFSRPLG